MSKPSLYERAVELVQSRPSVSPTNIATAIGCTLAQAKSYVRVMRNEGILGSATGVLNRYPVVGYQAPEGADLSAIIDADDPAKSVLFGQDVPIDSVLNQQAQQQLRKLVDAALQLERQKADILDLQRALYANGKALGMPPAILRKVVSIVWRRGVETYNAERDLIDLYLHTLGEVIEDNPAAGQTIN